MIWRSIQFDWPQAAWLLLGVLALVWGFFSLYQYRRNRLDHLAHSAILNSIVERRSQTAYWVRAALCCLAWICGVLALMQPKGNERFVAPSGEQALLKQKNQTVRKKQHDIIFLIDASASMGVADSGAKDSLSVAKEIVDGVVSHLKGEDAVLYAFTSATMQLVPPTADYLFFRLMLRQIQINEGETSGTDIRQALEVIHKRYLTVPTMKLKTLVLLTDGGDTHIDSLQGQEKEAAINDLLKVIDSSWGKQMRIFAVGIGSQAGKVIPRITYQGKPVIAALDASLLRKLAARSGGKAFFTDQMTTLQISDAILASIAEEPSGYSERITSLRDDNTLRLYDYYFQWPLGLALATLALALLLPESVKGASKMRALKSLFKRGGR